MMEKLVRVVTWEADEETGARCVIDIIETPMKFRNDGKLSAKSCRQLSEFTELYVSKELYGNSGGISCQMEVING